MLRLFVSDAQVERWVSHGALVLEGETMTIRAVEGEAQLVVRPAVYFERIDGGETDSHNLVGVVRTLAELQRLGAEHYDTAVVLGDLAYTVIPGFSAAPLGENRSELPLEAPQWGQTIGVLQRLSQRTG